MPMNIAFFDFDGTITAKDTLIQFIRFSKGTFRFYLGILILSPVLLAFKIGILQNWRAKEILFSWFFRGTSEIKIQNLGAGFASQIIPSLIRPEAEKALAFHKNAGNRVVVVSASFSVWIEPWCKANQIELIATEYEIRNGKLTGLIQGENCYGKEKVRRIRTEYSLKKFDQIYAYGDSKADLEMLNLADVKYMRWKKME
jgi:HAD superfamily hydrolase (TIGR01490 family)